MNWAEPLEVNDHEYVWGGPLTPAHTPIPFLPQSSPSLTAKGYTIPRTPAEYPSSRPADSLGDVHRQRPHSAQQQLTWQKSTPVSSLNTTAISISPRFIEFPGLLATKPAAVDNFYANSGKRLGLGIQTPPLTDASLRTIRSAQPGLADMSEQRRLSIGGRTVMGPPETPSRITQASPQLFTNSSLQFSPDLFPSHLMSGAQTAPAYPQQRLFWDSSTPSGDVFSTQSPYQNSFALPQDHLTSPFAPSPGFLPAYSTIGHQQQAIVPSQEDSSSTIRTARPAAFDARFPAPFTTSPRMAPLVADDPSLFLSSPARRFGGSHNNTSFGRPAPEKPAYHHQIEESKREREVQRARKAKAKTRRSSSIQASRFEPRRSISPAASNGRGTLKRTSTYAGTDDRRHSYHQSQVSFASTVSVHSNRPGVLPHKGRSSPLKPSHDYSNHQARQRKRTSLTFTIDKDGTAKTVVTKLPDEELMDLDEESAESDSDSADQPVHSFAFETQDESPAVSRLRKEWNHSKNSSYSSRHSSHTSSSNSNSNSNSNRTNDGNAKEALRAILHDRASGTSTSRSASLSQPHQFHSSPPIPQQRGYNASPTTITDPDISTPSTDHGSEGSTRCVCNSSSSPDGRQYMIQCESCSKWLHMHCVGIDSRATPTVYICVYCAQTPGPSRRGRKTLRAVNGSPLAHKSLMQPQPGHGRSR